MSTLASAVPSAHRLSAPDGPAKLAVPPRAAFVEVPTAAFAFVRAVNGQAGLDAASLQTVIAALRKDIEDASRDLAAAIGRRLGEPRRGRDRRRERRRRRLGSEGRGDG